MPRITHQSSSNQVPRGPLRRRRGIALGVPMLLLLLGLGGRPALAQETVPPTYLAPADAASWRLGAAPGVFRIRTFAGDDPGYLWLNISRSPARVHDCGTIGDGVDTDEFHSTADPAVFVARPTYFGDPDIWKPGTYYWQAFRISYADGADGCVEGPVRSFTFTARGSSGKGRRITFGEKVTINGTFSGHSGGDAGRAVRLVALPYPYTTEKVVATSKTSSTGAYSFTAKPGYNTRYVVREQLPGGTAEAPKVFVIVDPKQRFEFGEWKYNVDAPVYAKQKIRLRLTFGPGLATDFTGRPVFWYFWKKGSKTAKRFDKSRLTQEPGKLTTKTTLGLTDADYSPKGHVVQFCFDEPAGDDGLGEPRKERCPRGKHVPVDDLPR